MTNYCLHVLSCPPSSYKLYELIYRLIKMLSLCVVYVNQGVADCNHCMRRLVILHAQILIPNQKPCWSDLLGHEQAFSSRLIFTAHDALLVESLVVISNAVDCCDKLASHVLCYSHMLCYVSTVTHSVCAFTAIFCYAAIISSAFPHLLESPGIFL